MAWATPLARVGFTARGLVYILVGFLAAKSAAGFGGRATDPQGAMDTLGRGPFGAVLLAAIGLGLVAYAGWRFAQAAFDLDDKGDDLKGRAVRVGYAFSGLVHLGLAFTAATLAFGLRRRGRGDEVRLWTSRVFEDAPFGVWLVGLAGAVVIGAGLFQIHKAWTYDFEEHLRLSSMGTAERRWARRIGRAGLVTRGLTFGLIGWFLVKAFLETDAREARGLAGALRSLRVYEHGELILGAVGLGLCAYGALSLVNARYRRIA